MTVARPDTLFSLIPAYRAAMFNRASAFNQFRTLFAPRKPRHPLVRVAVGLLGLAIPPRWCSSVCSSVPR